MDIEATNPWCASCRAGTGDTSNAGKLSPPPPAQPYKALQWPLEALRTTQCPPSQASSGRNDMLTFIVMTNRPPMPRNTTSCNSEQQPCQHNPPREQHSAQHNFNFLAQIGLGLA